MTRCPILRTGVALVLLYLASLPLPAAGGIPLSGDVPTLAPMIAQITPAVVNIAVVSRVPVQENPLLRDPFFRRFFNVPDAPRQETRQISAGSGVIIDSAHGYVLTNHHVTAPASDIFVTLKDRRRFKAKLVGSDPATDVAVLQIDADHLTALPVGNSDNLQVGDFVVAIGNPFGLGQTVTSGIVSALGRSGLNIEGYEDFIQTDASINPGNSGGALVNLRGELIGINTAILAPAGGNVGIGFAVPSNMVRSVMEQIVRSGEVKRGRLGVRLQDVGPDIAESLRLPEVRGALVSAVEEGSPAEQAGVKTGDVIVAVDGRAIDSPADLRARIGLMPVGERIEMTAIRDGRPITLAARVEDLPVRLAEVHPKRVPGLTLRDLETEEQQALGGGVLVAGVGRGSLAQRSGLRVGDIIVAINRVAVDSVATADQILKQRSSVIAINVVRGNEAMLIIVQ